MVFFIYLIWTKDVNILRWFNEKAIKVLPIDNSLDKQLELVNVLISPNQNKQLALYIHIDESVDKIQDISLTITTNDQGSKGTVGLLKTIRDFKYFSDLLSTPYSTTDFIDHQIINYQKWSNTGPNGLDTTKINLEAFNGDEIILEWRDAENKKHIKKWPYIRYRNIVDGLKKGPIPSEKSKNVFVNEMKL